MQAVLLSEYYLRFRGRDKDAFQTSDLFTLLYQKVRYRPVCFMARLINKTG